MHLINPSQLSYDNWVEIIATSTGLLSVLLASRENIWNFLFGTINASSFFFLFHDKKLYADMTLHAIYVGFQIYGFYEWRFGGKKKHGIRVYSAKWSELSLAMLITAFLAAAIYYILTHYTHSTSIPLDSTTTAMSLVASWMLARKWIANWWLWLVMDALAIVMMYHKQLYLSMGLYGLYVVLCVYGIYQWNYLLKHPELEPQLSES